MGMLGGLITVLALGFAAEVRAESCSPVSLLDAGQAMASMQEPLNQGQIGSCFAHSAAQVIDAYRFSHGDKDTKFRTSALELGFSSTNGFKNRKFNGAFCNAFDRASAEGVCSEEAFQSAIEKWSETRTDSGQREISKVVDELAGHYNDYQAQKQALGDLEEAKRNRAKIVSGARCYLEETGIALTHIPDTEALERLLDEDSELKFLRGLIGHACSQEGRRKAVRLPDACVSRTFIGKGAVVVREVLRQRFERPAPLQPFAISVCGKALKEGRSLLGTKACDPTHMLLVIGRQVRDGKCHYRLRNSWGSDCAQYRDWKCEGGDLWISEEDMGLMALGIHFLE